MGAVERVLVVGSGIAGLAAATLLAREGVEVEVAEIDQSVGALGSGITLQGNALRVLHQLGVWDEVLAAGYPFDTLGFRAPDGTLLVEMVDERIGGPDLPATLGMHRPDLSRVMAAAARAAGVTIRLGLTVSAIDTLGDKAVVALTDGTTGSYDLVVGADGVRSTTRGLIGIDTGPEPTGMGIWRLHARRPESIVHTDLTYGGPCYIAGYCPTGPDTCYAYLVEGSKSRDEMPPVAEYPEHMQGLAAGYGGVWSELAAQMDDPERVNYTRFEAHFVPAPWHRGRVVLIGDAAHSCPPTLAQGAAMSLEDASVLAEGLTSQGDLDAALDAFSQRRAERVKTVVDASVQLCQWMLDHSPDADVPGLMGRINQLVGQPA